MARSSLSNVSQFVRRIVDDPRRSSCTDRELLHSYCQGDAEAFSILMKRHSALVLNTARRVLTDEHAAEDVFQATFLILSRKATSRFWNESVAGWLHQVARRLAFRAMRSKPISEYTDSSTTQEADPLSQVSGRELLVAIEQELANLPAKYREAVLLCGIEGLSREDAAQRLGWTVGSVKGRLERGRELLRCRLERRGFSSGMALLGLSFSSPVVARELFHRTQQLLNAEIPCPKSVIHLINSGLASTTTMKLFVSLSAMILVGVGAFLFRVDEPKRAEQPLPKQDQIVSNDGDLLPEGAVFRLGTRKYKVEGRVAAAHLTPDGKYVLTMGEPDISSSPALGLTLTDLQTGLPVRSFEDGHLVPKKQTSESIPPMAFSPDGKKLYGLVRDPNQKSDEQMLGYWGNLDFGCSRLLVEWDVATGKKIVTHVLPKLDLFFQPSLVGLRVSPDGKRLYVWGSIRMKVTEDRSVRGEQGIHVLEAETGKRIETWKDCGWCIGWINEGKQAVTLSKSAIEIRDSQTGQITQTLKTAGQTITACLTSDGKTLARLARHESEGKKRVEVERWDLKAEQIKGRILLDDNKIGWQSRLLFAKDDSLLYVGTAQGSIIRCDLMKGSKLPEWQNGHAGGVADMFLQNEGKELVSVGRDGCIRRWDLQQGKPIPTGEPYRNRIGHALSPDKTRLAIADQGGRIDLWDLQTRQVIRTMQSTGYGEHQLAFSPDGRLLVDAAMWGKSAIWDLTTGKISQMLPDAPKNKMQEHGESSWNALCFTADGKYLIASKHWLGTWMWEVATWKIVWHVAEIETVWFSPDGEMLYTGEWHRRLKQRNWKTGEVIKELAIRGETSLTFWNKAGLPVVGDLGGNIRFWEWKNDLPLKEIKGFQKVWQINFSPSGRLMVVCEDTGTRILDTLTWEEVYRFKGHRGAVRSAYFAPNEETLVTISSEDGTGLIWNLRPGQTEKPQAEAMWNDLKANATRAEQAMWMLANHPEVAVELFRNQWPIGEKPDPKRIAKLIADLDSPRFKVREDATTELLKSGRNMRKDLQAALAKNPSPELTERIQTILQQLRSASAFNLSEAEIVEVRAIWTLERCGTLEAKKLLQDWSQSATGYRLSEEATEALNRWK